MGKAVRLAYGKTSNLYFFRSLNDIPPGGIVLFPLQPHLLACGLAGIIARKPAEQVPEKVAIDEIDDLVKMLEQQDLHDCLDSKNNAWMETYMGGEGHLRKFARVVTSLKREAQLFQLFTQGVHCDTLKSQAQRLNAKVNAESEFFSAVMGKLDRQAVETISRRLETIRDIAWCLDREIVANLEKIRGLIKANGSPVQEGVFRLFKRINTVLNSLDRLEVRGRDSAGISIMLSMTREAHDQFSAAIEDKAISKEYQTRRDAALLMNRGIGETFKTNHDQTQTVFLTLTYKIAAEIGALGDNIGFLRSQIETDAVLHCLVQFPFAYHSIATHTRWASVGAISEPNCHPVDNGLNPTPQTDNLIHACLNGDIDNYLELRVALEAKGYQIPEGVSTDTKIIPLQIDAYLALGHDFAEAFRLAVNDFEGSHAILVHSDQTPGKLYLAQKGSGQALFIGISPDYYMPTSEVYGFVEETSNYLKLDGEAVVEGLQGPTQGQVFILDQSVPGALEDVRASYYDGTLIALSDADVKTTEITSRDIDRQDFDHYFLKEISEAPRSVVQTLLNRWKVNPDDETQLTVSLDETMIPPGLASALSSGAIKKIYFVGQGTAGVAAQACADLLGYYLGAHDTQINALKASELSGFRIDHGRDAKSMGETLVVAISQSGTTTDTNRTVDMVRERGAYTLAIVNRRDSHITFKVDGVLYTSSGRDIEMSVASTKAFYSQIVAGALLGLYIARIKGRRSGAFISEEIRQLQALPDAMNQILKNKASIAQSAAQHAVAKTYWATVGSGPNKAAADEIRIKLSELCYKTISADYVEDKKHIDLSSEPLIIICAAGAGATVIGDIIKDTAIFQAHKATPIVIADEGQRGFEPYAANVIYVPAVPQHLASIVNTLAGHLWGYYAALAIHAGSRFLFDFREEIRKSVVDHGQRGVDIYELILQESFRERVARFYREFHQLRRGNRFPIAFGEGLIPDISLLLKYLTGRLPVADFELDFDQKGTAANMLTVFYEKIGELINRLSRPVDAIKHQAKTVTVGTSRLSARLEGLLFDTLRAENFSEANLINRNILVLRNVQDILAGIAGSVLYKIEGLNLLGETTENTSIAIVRKTGSSADIPSRVEHDSHLKGTKRIIVERGNVYIGQGRKDGRSLVVIPIMSTAAETSNQIEYLLLLNIIFKDDVPLATKIKALGGKFGHIKQIAHESSIEWQDSYLEQVSLAELFGLSAEKIAETIVSQIGQS
ncbi:MAG: SIS domain-containing protein [Desulfobacterales bacterium]